MDVSDLDWQKEGPHMNTRQVINDLAAYRRRKGIAQKVIANRMGVCKVAVTNLKNQQDRNPKWPTVIKYARALGVRLEQLPEEAME